MKKPILVLLLIPLLSYGQKIEIGKINNAPFKIIIPENWNEGLVMYVRGAGGGGPQENFNENENKKLFNKTITSRGYALAYSAFSKEGDAFFDVTISTISPFFKSDCNVAGVPLILHPIALFPILV